MFQDAAPIFLSSFTNSRLLKFEGAHAYPPLSRSPKLREAIEEFLDAHWSS